MLLKKDKNDLSHIDKTLSVYFGLLIFAVLIIVFSAAVFYFSYIIQKEQNRLGSIIANSVGNSINRVSFSGKYQGRLLVEDLKKQNENIDSIVIQDSSGLVIAHSTRENNGKILNDTFFEEAKKVIDTDTYIIQNITITRDNEEVDLIEIDMPYKKGYENQISGVSRVFLSKDALNELIYNALIYMGFLIVLLAVLSYLVIKILSERIGAPIKNLAYQLQGILKYAPLAINITNKQGKSVAFSEQFGKLNLKDYEKIDAQNEKYVFESTKIINYDFVLNIDGKERYFNAIKCPIAMDENGMVTLVSTIGIDITDKKAIEANLIEAKKQADAANNAKSGFLANMSHEIRTPLNGVIGLTELVLKTTLNEHQREYLSKIEHSSKALLSIINDILDYSKIEAGKLDLEQIKFNPEILLSNISDLFGYQAYLKGLNLVFKIDRNIPSTLIGDPLRITQVLNNLVGNAIKFTNAGEVTIEISFKNKKQESIELLFSIQDSGIGITHEQQQRLFSPFEQADSSSTRKYGGTGLGLMISKQIIELMGGTIEMKSDYGVGSVFSFNVHLDYLDNNEKYKQRERYLADKNFLVVDDLVVESEILRELIVGWGADVSVCESGQQAIELAKTNDYDYLILDWKLPDIDGVDVMKALRSHFQDKKVPTIIMTTAYSQKELLHEAKSKEVHIEQILIKPYTPSSLFNTIVNYKEFFSDNKIHTATLQFNMNGKVLLVEDNEINRLVASDILQSFGLEVKIAHNGLEAVEMAKNEKFDFILMDLQMPIMDGFEASKKIREFNSNIPIVALSAAVMQKDKELTKEAGMDAHISKPINQIELQEVLSRYLDTQTIVLPASEVDNKVGELGIESHGIDLEKLSRTIKKSEKMYAMLHLFANEFRDFSTKIKELPVEGEAFGELIHNLKGVSGNLSLTYVYNFANAIHTNADLNKKMQLLPLLLSELHAVIETIDTHIPKSVQHPVKNYTKEETTKFIREILVKLDGGEFIDDDLIETLLNQIEQLTDTNMAQKLKRYFLLFDYQMIKLTLNDIVGELDE